MDKTFGDAIEDGQDYDFDENSNTIVDSLHTALRAVNVDDEDKIEVVTDVLMSELEKQFDESQFNS